MGDRRMVKIKTSDGSLYVYSHSRGHELPKTVKDAIRFAEPRWRDTSYAVRILVDQITKTNRDSELGFGLMLKPDAEDEYNHDKPSIIIDLQDQVLTIINGENEDGTLLLDCLAFSAIQG